MSLRNPLRSPHIRSRIKANTSPPMPMVADGRHDGLTDKGPATRRAYRFSEGLRAGDKQAGTGRPSIDPRGR